MMIRTLLLRELRETGAHGLARTDLTQRVNGRFDGRRFDDIVGNFRMPTRSAASWGLARGATARPAARDMA